MTNYLIILILSLTSLSTSKLLAKTDTSAVYQKYFGESLELSKQIVNPGTPENSRRVLVQRLTTDIEISKELAELANAVRSDAYFSTLQRPTNTQTAMDLTWKKLSIRILKSFSSEEVDGLVLRLRHKDNAVQSMALISLNRRLKVLSPLDGTALETATAALRLDEVAEVFHEIYERSRSVEPAFLEASKSKNVDRDIAAEVSRLLRQTFADR
jgi:hypothetical protein